MRTPALTRGPVVTVVLCVAVAAAGVRLPVDTGSGPSNLRLAGGRREGPRRGRQRRQARRADEAPGSRRPAAGRRVRSQDRAPAPGCLRRRRRRRMAARRQRSRRPRAGRRPRIMAVSCADRERRTHGGDSIPRRASRKSRLAASAATSSAAIRACRTYVIAQQLYARRGHDGRPAGLYATALRSDPGRQNGLYWPVVRGEKRSPLGDLIADAGDGRQVTISRVSLQDPAAAGAERLCARGVARHATTSPAS